MDLIRIPPTQYNDIAGYTGPVFLCTNDKMYLCADRSMYQNSTYCRRNSIELTREQLGELRSSLSNWSRVERDMADKQLIITFTHAGSFLKSLLCCTPTDFADLMTFIDMYGLDMDVALSSFDCVGWLLMIREREKASWQKNTVFLQNMEQAYYNRKKLTSLSMPDPRPIAADLYPTGGKMAAKVADASTLRILPRSGLAIDLVGIRGVFTHLGTSNIAKKIFAILTSSISHYHCCIRDADIVRAMRGTDVFNNAMRYAMRVAYLEELAHWRHRYHENTARYIFPLDVVNAWCLGTQKLNDGPLAVFLAQRVTSPGLTLPSYIIGARGVYAPNEAIRNIALFTNDVLKYIDWTSTALCGSSIAASVCINPLRHQYKTQDDFLADHYPSLYSLNAEKHLEVQSTCTPFDQVGGLSSACVDETVSSDSERSDDEPVPMSEKGKEKVDEDATPRVRRDRRTAGLNRRHQIQSYKAVENIINVSEGSSCTKDVPVVASSAESVVPETADIDIAIECSTMEEFDVIAHRHYDAIKRAADELDLYNRTSQFKPCLTMEREDTITSHKWIVRGLPRNVDIFRVDNISACVSRFHLGCVRAWYDGHTIHCFPSFIIAAHTGVNVDTRWMSSRKDIRDVVLKYHARGFGTYLNQDDLTNLITFIEQQTKYPKAFDSRMDGITQRTVMRSVPLFYSVFDKVFRPSMWHTGLHAQTTCTPCAYVDSVSLVRAMRGNPQMRTRYSYVCQKFNEQPKMVTPTCDLILSQYW